MLGRAPVDVGTETLRGPAPDEAGGRLAHSLAWVEHRSRVLIALLCATVVLVGLGYSLWLGSHMPFQDERDYIRIADNLAHKGMFSLDGVHPTAGRPPGWPLTLAPLRMIGLPIPAIRMVNVLLLATCLYLLYLILSRAWSPLMGLVGAAGGVLYVLFFYTAETLYPQMLEAALILGLVYLLFDPTRLSLSRRAAAGLAAGFLLLIAPNLVLLLPLFFLIAPGAWRTRLATALVAGVLALAVIGTWTVRNYRTFHRIVFISSNGGGNLLVGNLDNRTPETNIAEQTRRVEGRNEFDQDSYYRSVALRYILDHKREAAVAYVKKVVGYFNFRNNIATRSEASRAKNLVLAISYGTLLVLAATRIAMFRRIPLSRLDKALLALYLASALVMALTAPRIRYRVPFDFLLLGLGAPAALAVVAALSGRALSPTMDARPTPPLE